MRFITCPPSPPLAGLVQEMWLLEDDGALHAGLPKPFVEIVVSLTGEHWWRARMDGREYRYRDSWVTPLQDGPRYARAKGGRRLVGARLEPWVATALFGPLPAGNGRPPPRLALFGAKDAQMLRRAVVGAADDQARFAAFAGWLERRTAALRSHPDVPPVITGLQRVDDLALAAGIGSRTLRRRFQRDTGVTPKRWLTLRRIDGVLRNPDLLDPHSSLAAIACDHGYADQAHFSREMARFTGATPGGLRARSREGPPHLLPRG